MPRTETINAQPDPRAPKERILILAPTGRDAQLAAVALRDAGITTAICRSIEELCDGIEGDAGGAMVTEEALTAHGMSCLHVVLERQPPWSDLPLIVFTSQPFDQFKTRSFDALGRRANITYLERPIRVKTLVSAAQAALRARRRQYEVRQLVDELQHRIQERDQFLAMLGHELRNPLAAITLAIDSLHGDEANGTHDILKRQTRHLRKLVDDLLDIGRISSGKIILHRAEIDLAEIVGNCVEAMRGRASAHRLSLRLDRSEVFVHGDADRLEQVVSNLLSNAIKYTPAGGAIEVFVGRQGDEAVLRVRDTGKGIAPDMLHRIFELFTQADVTLDRADGGMGIGLTLVRKLVELHGGSVEALSAGRGSGSEFVVRMPAVVPKERTVPREEPAPAPARDGASSKRIVVIEDNSDIRMLLGAELKRLGHEVDDAGTGVEGLQKILEAKPDVALIDIGLPELDGYSIARRVRESLGDAIYLIALSGYGQAEDRQRAHEAGFDVHLTKPAGIMELERVLARG
jgi:signal transduction histidine kinase/CheY-like chemotaxis protein